jgi:1-acyl-sn-glycerol-3-phosphate acyltransferase
MRYILRAYQITSYCASFALFAVLSLALNCFCLALGWVPGLAGRERFFQRLVHRDFAVFVRFLAFARVAPIRYEGFERWPARSGLVVVANHPGLLDIGWMLARLPEAICIYKPDVANSPFYGATARCAGYLSSSHARLLLRTAAAKIAAGQTLLVFPEGTRTRTGALNPLKPGFVVMARMAQAPIQLVRINCDSDLLTKARAWWRVPRLPATVTVTLGPCLPPPGEDTAAVVAGIEAWFRHPAEAPFGSAARRPPVRAPAHT